MIRLASVFSGIGAIEHAFIKQNINHKIIFASDIDKYCKKSYFANYSINENQWYDNILDINGSIYKNQIDLLVGGSPCQSFSVLGKRKGLDDDRGQLTFKFIELINKIKPKIFIFENVKGLFKNKDSWDIVYNEFKKTNYTLYHSILNAKDYGIPQNRLRLFIIGFLEERTFTFPKKEKLKITIKNLLEEDIDSKYILSQKGIDYVKRNTAKKFTQIDGDIALCQTKHQQYSWRGDFVSVDSNKIRKLTPRECLRLMGFSDIFKIAVCDTRMYSQAGNSIVVNVLEKLLNQIYFDII